MEGIDESVLPYRAGAEEVDRWMEARARGKSHTQIRAMGFPTKSFEGTVVAVSSLGLVDGETEELTERGRRYTLASEAERTRILRAALAGYPPYRRLLRAISQRGADSPTDMQWIETWWATHGFGSSQSNRMEGATAFGRLVESVGLGKYIPGRRGHPSRIEWREDPGELVKTSHPDDPSPSPPDSPAERAPVVRSAEPAAPPRRHPMAERDDGNYSTVTLEVRPGQVVRISAPAHLTASEKRRLLTLLDALITEEPEG
jgi:hypothetical protein